MGKLILQGNDTDYPGFSLLGETTLAIKFDETGSSNDFNRLEFLDLSGTTSVSIASTGVVGGFGNLLFQLEENNNVLTTVTISGSEHFNLGVRNGHNNSGDGVVTDIAATAASPTTIHSSLTLINASATTGGVFILAGGTSRSGDGPFGNGASLNPNITITYTGLTIKGGSGDDHIDNDAKNGIVTDGNGQDLVILGGAGAKAILGAGTGDIVIVGASELGTIETAGSALGDKVTFGSAATAQLIVAAGAEVGLTINNASIGLTKVVGVAANMEINFGVVTHLGAITDETAAVASATTLKAAENDAIALAPPGVAYFSFHGNEYFIATNNIEGAVSANDAIVELVGVTNIHNAINSAGLVTLHV